MLSNFFKSLAFILFLTGCALTPNSKTRAPANQSRIQTIESDLLANYAIEVRIYKRGGNSLVNSVRAGEPSESDYLNFVDALLTEANENLTGKVFFPEKIVLFATNRGRLRDKNIELATAGRINVDSSIENARRVIGFLKMFFPAQETVEASEMRRRNEAVKTAIVAIMSDLLERRIEVRLCGFVNSLCRYSGEESISYFRQEKLLKGLIHLQIRLENGDERRPSISLEEYVSTDGDESNFLPSWYNFRLRTRINNRFNQLVSTG